MLQVKDPFSCRHSDVSIPNSEEGFASSLSMTRQVCFAYNLVLWFNNQESHDNGFGSLTNKRNGRLIQYLLLLVFLGFHHQGHHHQLFLLFSVI